MTKFRELNKGAYFTCDGEATQYIKTNEFDFMNCVDLMGSATNITPNTEVNLIDRHIGITLIRFEQNITKLTTELVKNKTISDNVYKIKSELETLNLIEKNEYIENILSKLNKEKVNDKDTT